MSDGRKILTGRARVYFKSWPAGLVPIAPALRPGQRVPCAECAAHVGEREGVRADVATPGRFVCLYCAGKPGHWRAWNMPHGDVAAFVAQHGPTWTRWAVDGAPDPLPDVAPPKRCGVVVGPPDAEALAGLAEGRSLCSDCARPCYGPGYRSDRPVCGACAKDYI